MFKRILFFTYGVICYLIFLPTFLYAVGFVGNFRIPVGEWVFVPKSMDIGGGGPFWESLAIDLLLLGLFAVQHSVMARRGFKRMWTRIVPPPIERSTYVLASSIALIVLFYFWRPLGGVVWDTTNDAVRYTLVGLSLAGWSVVLLSTFLINHFELFGLQQIHAHLKGREMPAPKFVMPLFYKIVRHPLYVGFVIAFWATPTMTVGHLVFAVATTTYIVLAIQFEERDLIRVFGDRYTRYQHHTPMLVPRVAPHGKKEAGSH
jgi:protein-S-isoprenylcysteine O-methyltransferase Ste14